MTKDQIEAVLEGVRSWPQPDQEELVELVREIEARRSGVYVMTDEERGAVARSRQTALVPEDEVQAFWKARGLE
jgi:beta-glucosidase-like glycosyl hydrolase